MDDKPRREGLYPDPRGSGLQRYFDGVEWTDITVPYPQQRTGVLTIAGGIVLAVLVLVWLLR